MKKNTAIVLGATSNMSFAIGTFLINLKKYCKDFADVIIYHEGISKRDQRIIKKIIPVRFIKFDIDISLDNMDNYTRNRFTKLVFFKYACLKLLSQYKNVIITDYDIILLSDISDLIKTQNKDTQCKTMHSDADFLKTVYKNGNFEEAILNEDSFYYSRDTYPMGGGLMVIYDTIKNYDEMYDYCVMKTNEYIKYLVLPEQAIMSIMLEDFKIKREEIDVSVYVVHPRDLKDCPNAKILHAYGDDKFWDRLQNDTWDKNYKEWIDMGGSNIEYCANYIENQKNEYLEKINSIAWWIPIKSIREKFRSYMKNRV